MGKHQRGATGHKWAQAVTAGVALQVVGLFSFSYAASSPVAGVSLLAATTVFVDGTKDMLPTGDNQHEHRMRDALSGTGVGVPGAFDQCPTSQQCDENVFVKYPRSFGVLTGLTDTGYDASKAEATQAIKNAIKDNPTETPIYVVGYSQGANAAADALRELEHENATNPPDAPDVDLSDVTFVLLGNGLRNDGGITARFPRGVYVPLMGITLGGGTNSDSATVIQVSKQYDWISDAPKYVLNPVAWANGMLGFIYAHNGYYDDVTIPDLNGDNVVDEADWEVLKNPANDHLLPPNIIVTRNGKVIDVLVKNPEGQLPLTRPLLDLGVPQEVVTALDPLLRAIIETGYDRPTDGRYPSEPVPFGLAPGPSQWVTDFQSIAAGYHETLLRLAALNHANGAEAIDAPQQGVLAAAAQQEPTFHEQQEGQLGARQQLQAQTLTQQAPTMTSTEPLQPPAPAGQTLPTQVSLPSSQAQTTTVPGPVSGSPPPLPRLKRIASEVISGFAGAVGIKPRVSGGSSDSTTNTEGTGAGNGTDTGAGTGTDDDNGDDGAQGGGIDGGSQDDGGSQNDGGEGGEGGAEG